MGGYIIRASLEISALVEKKSSERLTGAIPVCFFLKIDAIDLELHILKPGLP